MDFFAAIVLCGSEKSDSKLSTSVLRALADGSMSMNDAKAQPQTASAQVGDGKADRSFLLHSDDRIGFTAAVDEPSKSAALVERLQDLGAVYVSSFGGIVSGFIEPQLLKEFEKIADVKFAREEYVSTNTGSVTSKGDAAAFANKVRSTLNCAGKSIDGTGITVGVLSDSFSCKGIGAGQATNDIPSVEILEEISSCATATDEGRAMAEIVYDLAPGAKIKFCSAFNGLAAFANCIIKLQQAGCTVIVDDVFYFSEAAYQDDVVAQAVDLVKSRGVSYFSSAGNQARNAYEAPFRPTTASVTIAGYGKINNGNFHDFDPSATTQIFQRFTVPAGTTHSNTVILKWVDRYFSISGAPGALSDVDIFIVKITTGPVFTYVTSSEGGNIGGDAVEIMRPNSLAAGNYAVMILLFRGPAPALLRYTMLGGSLPGLTFKTNSSTCGGHANARGAMAVGAVNAAQTPVFGVNPPVLESFSSAGGQLVYFDTKGVLLTTPENRRKPDFSCFDGAITTFFGSGNIFFGTSAAAPHAAAIAALTLQARPALSVDEVYSILKQTAVDFLAPGYDEDSGTGLCNAAAAVNAAVNNVIVNRSAPQPCESNRCALFSATGIIPPLASTVCRSAATTCDLAETCSSASASCPSDVKKSFGDTCNDGNAATSNDICVTSDTCCGRTSTDHQLTLTGPLQSLFVSDPRTSSLGVLSCKTGQQNRRREIESSSSSSSDDSDDEVSREVAFRFQVSLDKAVDCDVEAIWFIDTQAVARAIWHKSQSKLHLTATKIGRVRFGLHNIRVELNPAGKDVCSVPLSPFTATTDVKFK